MQGETRQSYWDFSKARSRDHLVSFIACLLIFLIAWAILYVLLEPMTKCTDKNPYAAALDGLCANNTIIGFVGFLLSLSLVVIIYPPLVRTNARLRKETEEWLAAHKEKTPLEIKASLNQNQLLLLQSEFEKKKKSAGVAYLLLILAGVFGAHKFYLGKTIEGVIYLFTFGLLLIGVFIDIFILPQAIRQANDLVEKKIIEELLKVV